MDSRIQKIKDLCDKGICTSLAEARRLVDGNETLADRKLSQNTQKKMGSWVVMRKMQGLAHVFWDQYKDQALAIASYENWSKNPDCTWVRLLEEKAVTDRR